MNDDKSKQLIILSSRLKKIQDNSNQLATAHACLQDFYGITSSVLLATNLTIPVFLLATSLMPDLELTSFFAWLATVPFVYPAVLTQTPLTQATVKYTTAILSIFCFLTTLLELLIKPKEQSEIHKKAVDHYTLAKYRIRDLRESIDGQETCEDQIRRKLTKITKKYLSREEVPAVPELLFLFLKLWHEFKLLISDLISTTTTSSRFVLTGLISGKFFIEAAACLCRWIQSYQHGKLAQKPVSKAERVPSKPTTIAKRPKRIWISRA